MDTASGSLADAGQTRRYEPDPEYSYSRDEFERRIRRYSPAASSRSAAPRAPRSTPARPKRGNSNPLIGQQVRHPSYGLGTIIHVDGEDEDRKLTVSFADHGTKKLVERFANLSWA